MNDQGEHAGRNLQAPTQEEFDRAVEKALQNKAPMPIYKDIEQYNVPRS